MIKFLIKGVLRDHHRSLFPIIIVTLGVALTVLLNCYIGGVFDDIIDVNAKFYTGHVKVMTRAYAENEDQVPNDLALVGVNELMNNLRKEYPDMIWIKRIKFGGLLDVPDKHGETKTQGPTFGMAADLFSEGSTELDRLNIRKALIRGRLPQKPGEILISDEFAIKMRLNPGETVTLISSTMYGGMAMQNFVVTGTIRFGNLVMDRSAIVIDITDARYTLDMEDAASEILGFFSDNIYDDLKAQQVAARFNGKFANSEDEFSPVMLRLKEASFLAQYLDYAANMGGIMVIVFLLAMSIVLWNAGLLGGLRRYGEIGVRLAIGENKSHVYRSMIYESIIIGIIGSVIGTIIGLGFSYLLTKGIDISSLVKNTTMMMPSVYRAKITDNAYYIGFIPGLLSTVLGTMLAGVGIYRRQTASLFKELET